MNIVKNIISIATLTILLSSCSQQNTPTQKNNAFKIKGALGLIIGQQAAGFPEGYIIENKAFPFTPDKPAPYFVSHTFSMTPNSHVIYGFKSKGSISQAKQLCLQQRDTLIKETTDTYDTDNSTFKISTVENKWTLRENNRREISIDCERSLNASNLQLVMTYQDTELSLLAYKEWAKRQSDITKFRP